ncbi:MAG: Lrp/AsnC family transcriptional regulator [Pseudomonadota bacterium]
MDEIDHKILRALQRDGRMTNLKLAEEVNLSPTPCLKRVRKLEEAGVIRRYVAVVDPQAAGKHVCVLIMMKIAANTRDAADSFAAAIGRIEAVTECHTVSGRYDYLCKVYARDVAEYETLVKTELSGLPGLVDMETLFVLSTPVDPRGLPI